MRKIEIAIAGSIIGIAAAWGASAQTVRLPFEGTWRQRPNTSCEFPTSITKASITERRPGSSDTYRIVGVKRRNELVYELAVRVEDKRGHSQPTKKQILRIEIENDDAINAGGPYFAGQTVEFLRCPDRISPGAAAVVPSAPAREPKVTPDCSAMFERTYDALRRQEIDLAGSTGAVMRSQPQLAWDFCPTVREEIAVARRIIAAANACPSHRGAAGIKSEAQAKLAKRQRELSRPRCM